MPRANLKSHDQVHNFAYPVQEYYGETSLHTNERMNLPTRFIDLLAKRMSITGTIVNRMPKLMNISGTTMNQAPSALKFIGHYPQTRDSTTKIPSNLSTTRDIKRRKHLLERRMKNDGGGDDQTASNTMVSATLGKFMRMKIQKI